MVKGCQRQMVVLKCAADSAFESAYFILKNEKKRELGEDELLSQANRIINENCFSRKRKRGRRMLFAVLAAFLCGAVIASAATALALHIWY